MIIVPKLRGYKNVFTLYKSFCYGPLDALAGFLLVLVIISSIEESVANFDSLSFVSCVLSRGNISLRSISTIEECTHIVYDVAGALRRNLPEPEADERNLMARGKCRGGDHDFDGARLVRVQYLTTGADG